MSVGGDPRLCHSGQIIGSDVLSIVRVTSRTHSPSEASSPADPRASGETGPRADMTVVPDLTVVSHLNKSPQPAIASDSRLIQGGAIDTGGGTYLGPVTYHHTAHLGDSQMLLSIENIAKTTTPHHCLRCDSAVLAHLTAVEQHRSRADDGSGANLHLFTHKSERMNLDSLAQLSRGRDIGRRVYVARLTAHSES